MEISKKAAAYKFIGDEGYGQNSLVFVHLDTEYALGSDDCLYQRCIKNEFKHKLDFKPLLVYFAHDTEDAYNYAEDNVNESKFKYLSKEIKKARKLLEID